MYNQHTELIAETSIPPTLIRMNRRKSHMLVGGETNELQLYEWRENKAHRLASLTLLSDREVIVCCDWAAEEAAGSAVVGGSKGTIVVVCVLPSKPLMYVSYIHRVDGCGISEVKWMNSHPSWGGITTSGTFIMGEYIKQEWNITTRQFKSQYPSSIAWCPTDEFCIISLENKVFDPHTNHTFLSTTAEIKQLLWSPQIPLSISTIVVLTTSSIHFCSYHQSGKIQGYSQIKNLQTIQYVEWAHDYQHLAAYLTNQKNKNTPSVLSFQQSITGDWVLN